MNKRTSLAGSKYDQWRQRLQDKQGGREGIKNSFDAIESFRSIGIQQTHQRYIISQCCK
jgi:hypothetical protein